MKLSVIMPAYNEQNRILKAITLVSDAALKLYSEVQIIVVDDGSTDNTHFLVLKLNDRNVELVRHSHNEGKGSALQTGLLYAKFEHVLFIDSDMQIPPEANLKRFKNRLTLFDDKVDAVIGNKRHDLSIVAYTSARWFISNWYNILVRFVLGIPDGDTQCGFKLFKRDVIVPFKDEKMLNGFAFDAQLIYKLRQRGRKIVDAPVVVTQQLNQGSVSIKNILKTFKDILMLKARA